MRTFRASESLDEPVDFASRVKIAEQLIDHGKQVIRIFQHGFPCIEYEAELAKSLVAIRDLLVGVRDTYGFGETGPTISFGDEFASAYAFFDDGVKRIGESYLTIQASRYDDIDWDRPLLECDELKVGIMSLLDFLAVAFAFENGIEVGAAKSVLQFQRDCRRIGDERFDREVRDIDESDVRTPSIATNQLARMFHAETSQIRYQLRKAGVKFITKGKPGCDYIWERQQAITVCDQSFDRRSVGNKNA